MSTPYSQHNVDDEDVQAPPPQTKPLTKLSIDEVTCLLKSLNLSKYCAAFKENEVDGDVLIEFESVEEVIGLGISETEKPFAKKLLKKINEFKDSGVPLKMLSEVRFHC